MPEEEITITSTSKIYPGAGPGEELPMNLSLAPSPLARAQKRGKNGTGERVIRCSVAVPTLGARPWALPASKTGSVVAHMRHLVSPPRQRGVHPVG